GCLSCRKPPSRALWVVTIKCPSSTRYAKPNGLKAAVSTSPTDELDSRTDTAVVGDRPRHASASGSIEMGIVLRSEINVRKLQSGVPLTSISTNGSAKRASTSTGRNGGRGTEDSSEPLSSSSDGASEPVLVSSSKNSGDGSSVSGAASKELLRKSPNFSNTSAFDATSIGSDSGI